jgi:hypothetical protein
MWRTNGFERPAAGNALAAKPVLGLPEVQPALLDDVPHTAGSSARCRRSVPAACRRSSDSLDPQELMMEFLLDDEDDEVFDDEDFDEDAEVTKISTISTKATRTRKRPGRSAHLDFVGRSTYTGRVST